MSVVLLPFAAMKQKTKNKKNEEEKLRKHGNVVVCSKI